MHDAPEELKIETEAAPSMVAEELPLPPDVQSGSSAELKVPEASAEAKKPQSTPATRPVSSGGGRSKYREIQAEFHEDTLKELEATGLRFMDSRTIESMLGSGKIKLHWSKTFPADARRGIPEKTVENTVVVYQNRFALIDQEGKEADLHFHVDRFVVFTDAKRHFALTFKKSTNPTRPEKIYVF